MYYLGFISDNMKLNKNTIVNEVIPFNPGDMFTYKQETSIWPVWHSHKEIDILLFLASSGQHFTGDFCGQFKAGTLILNGSYIPHCFNTLKHVEADYQIAVLQFSKDTIGTGLLQKTDLKWLNSWLSEAPQSYEYFGETRRLVAAIMLEIGQLSGLDRMLQFLRLLKTLSAAPIQDKKPMVTASYTAVVNGSNLARIETIRKWVIESLSEKITLDQAAANLNMKPKYFSLFFKKNTGKNFSDFVKELRLGFACQYLLSSRMSVTEICFKVGYNNISNFNRQFLAMKGVTPSGYRKMGTK